jgi:hypothetical protein
MVPILGTISQQQFAVNRGAIYVGCAADEL